jgi:hypothetical protein
VIVQTCNHCPYVIAWNPRLRQAGRGLRAEGRPLPPDQLERRLAYPADSLDHMKRFVSDQSGRSRTCYDESQEVAQALDAVATPHVFVFDSEHRLVYQARRTADHTDESPGRAWLRWRDRRRPSRRAAGPAGDASARLQRASGATERRHARSA